MKQKAIIFFLSLIGFFSFALPSFAFSGSTSCSVDSSYNINCSGYSPSSSGHTFYEIQIIDSAGGGGSNCSGAYGSFSGITASDISTMFSTNCTYTPHHGDQFTIIFHDSGNVDDWSDSNAPLTWSPPAPTPTPTPYYPLSNPTTTTQITNLTTGLNNVGITGIGSVILIGGVLLITAALLFWVVMKFRGWLHI